MQHFAEHVMPYTPKSVLNSAEYSAWFFAYLNQENQSTACSSIACLLAIPGLKPYRIGIISDCETELPL